MPQFDFTTYGAQIFWFALCFAALYFSMSCVILPRVKNIILARKNLVEADLASAESINLEISQARSKADQALQESDSAYRSRLEESAKLAAKHKEKILEEFKEKSEKMIENSHNEIALILQKSSSQLVEEAKKIADFAQNKILNS